MHDPLVADKYFSSWVTFPDCLEGEAGSDDLSRYAGKWFEVASFPAWFENGARCSSAASIHMDDYVEAADMCDLKGEESWIGAEAVSLPGTPLFKLGVRFIWPFRSDYWIIALDKECRYAVVGHSEKKTLWILSRTPVIEEAVYQSLLKRALDQGAEFSGLRRVERYCPLGAA